MNRHERRAANRGSGLSGDARKVMDALIDYWIENSDHGRTVAANLCLTTPEARALIYELHGKGLLRFVKGEGEFDGAVPFWIEPVLPMGGWEGSRA